MKYSSLLQRIEDLQGEFPENKSLIEFGGYAQGYIEALQDMEKENTITRSPAVQSKSSPS